MRCSWCSSFRVGAGGICNDCDKHYEGEDMQKAKTVSPRKWYFYLIHNKTREVVDRRETPERIGMSWRAKGGKPCIIRKSLDGHLKTGDILVMPIELEMDEALKTGLNIDEWSV